MFGLAYEVESKLKDFWLTDRTYESVRKSRLRLLKTIRQTAACAASQISVPFSLYIAVNKINNKLYVGITKKSVAARKSEHFVLARSGGGGLFHKAIRKYGEDSFEFITYLKFHDYKKLLEWERRVIGSMLPEYNLTAGGEGAFGYRASPETRKKLSISHKGKVSKQRGIKRPTESVNRIVALRKARGNYITKGKIVVCIDDGKTFKTIKEAASFYGIEFGHLGQVLKGKFKTNKVKGRSFAFVE